jgi:hypothetical protein
MRAIATLGATSGNAVVAIDHIVSPEWTVMERENRDRSAQQQQQDDDPATAGQMDRCRTGVALRDGWAPHDLNRARTFDRSFERLGLEIGHQPKVGDPRSRTADISGPEVRRIEDVAVPVRVRHTHAGLQDRTSVR